MKRLYPAALALFAVLTPGTVQAQDRWAFALSDQVDLWYHGLAMTGHRGFATLPLYDPNYVDRVREEKQARGIYPTALDRMTGRLARALETDSTFEVLHFVPLYFASASREEMLTAVGRAAEGRAPPSSPVTRFGSSVLGATITDPDDRDLLSNFVAALRDEWDVFLSDYRRQLAADGRNGLSETASFWHSEVEPALEPLLTDGRLRGGIVFVSPAVGGEGRIFAGDPANTRDNVVIVGYPAAAAETIAAKVVKELCYPIASAAVSRLGLGGDRTMAERAASAGAVQCGAIAFERYLPELTDLYRDTFLRLSPLGSSGSFDAAFPATDRLLSEIAGEIP